MKGATIIEIVIYSAILMVFITALSSLLTMSLELQTRSLTSSAVSSDLRFIDTRLSYDIRRASSVINPAAAGDSSSYLELATEEGTIRYDVVNDELILTTPTSSAPLNGSDTVIPSFSVVRLEPAGGKENIRYSLAIESRITLPGGSVNSQTITSSVTLR